jgi:hypothetical protein
LLSSENEELIFHSLALGATMASEKFKNGGWKIISVALAFAVQLVTIGWGLSSMNSKINALEEMKPIVTDVQGRLIRVEAELANVKTNLETHQSRTEPNRGEGGNNGSGTAPILQSR